jgi:hypothetical protein
VIGDENFEWVVQHSANYLIEKAQAHQAGGINLTWGGYLQQAIPAAKPAAKPVKATAKPAAKTTAKAAAKPPAKTNGKAAAKPKKAADTKGTE